MKNQLWYGAVVVAISGSAAFASVLSSVALNPITSPLGDERTGAELDVTGTPSMDAGGSSNNVVVLLWIGSNNEITGIGWDVVLQTLVPGSKRSEITFAVRDTRSSGFVGFGVQPGFADPTPGGPTPYTSNGIVVLAEAGLPNVQAFAGGYVRLEFGEAFDNMPGVADAIWVSGVLSLQTRLPIPEIVAPGSMGLFSIAAAACWRRDSRILKRKEQRA